MANFEIKINDNIEVLYNKEIYKSKIQDVEDDSISIYFKNATLIDLSGGGLKFSTAEKLENEELITLKLKYHDNEIFIKSKVVRRNTNDNGDYTYGVEFIDISETDREKIIKLVFQIMRKQNEVI